ncbi:MAG: exodeoxyribonuclease III, partial [Anaerolineae bacterium]|nr:exodeoxyribonuclease III [Anaerolineae bacterium]
MPVLKIATFNANSIRVRLAQILSWVAQEKPDILCIQETKVQDKDFPRLEIENTGYYVVFKGQKSHAGVAILTRYEPSFVSAGFDDGADQARLLRMDIQKLHVINTYVPQGRDVKSDQFEYKLEWFRHLRQYFENNFQPTDPLIWTGDFNIATDDIDVYSPETLRNNP